MVCTTPTTAQDSLPKIQRIDSLSKLQVGSIEVIGNNKTKSYIILREMRVKAGDSIPAAHLYETLQQSRDLVYNTSLFSEVNVYPVMVSGTSINIFVVVRERWYIY
ncbi:MAG TPA: POTRA domain-containing protein, partial [Ferruginibacter sp.]|nr:POTRA domain-containing protein [Ferruginibacter sp.]